MVQPNFDQYRPIPELLRRFINIKNLIIAKKARNPGDEVERKRNFSFE